MQAPVKDPGQKCKYLAVGGGRVREWALCMCMHKLKEHIKIRKPENFQPYISKVAIATAAES